MTAGKGYRTYALSALTAVYGLNLLDRGLVALLLQPIKEDLHLSDTQLGFLTGIAFALFYATLGVPIARLSDRGNRVSIASCAILLWGLTVMACLWVTNFWQMLLARIAAAVGESGCKPPTYSLVGDYFPAPAERARAMGVYWLGSPLASLVAFIVGGWLNAQVGWRMTFFLMGLPGLLLAVLLWTTIAEPRRARAEPPPTIPFGEVMRTLWTRRSLRHLSLALILLYAMGAGLAPWYAAFMIRSHGMGTQELGLWLGLIFGIGGAVGALGGGWAAARWLPDNEPVQMRLSALTIAAIMPCFIFFLTASDKYVALLSLVPVMLAFNLFLGPTYALLQRLVDDSMRATSIAVIMLFANLIGMGLGPQIVGILSDLLHAGSGADSLRYAMLSLSFVALWAAYHFWAAARGLRADLAQVGSSGLGYPA